MKGLYAVSTQWVSLLCYYSSEDVLGLQTPPTFLFHPALPHKRSPTTDRGQYIPAETRL